MSAQPPFDQPYGQLQSPPPPPGYDFSPAPRKTNTMSILGLVFAFLIPLLGAVFSAIGFRQTRERNEGGRGLAVAGLILSIVFAIGWVFVSLFVFAKADSAVNAGIDAAASSASQALSSPSAAAKDDKGVANACHVIIPAAADFTQSAGSTPQEIEAKLSQLAATLQGAAAGTTDAQFMADVQKLADDFTSLSVAVAQGTDPSSLEGVLTTDGSTIDQDCAAVGVTG
jgi:hypothetical protein